MSKGRRSRHGPRSSKKKSSSSKKKGVAHLLKTSRKGTRSKKDPGLVSQTGEDARRQVNRSTKGRAAATLRAFAGSERAAAAVGRNVGYQLAFDPRRITDAFAPIAAGGLEDAYGRYADPRDDAVQSRMDSVRSGQQNPVAGNYDAPDPTYSGAVPMSGLQGPGGRSTMSAAAAPQREQQQQDQATSPTVGGWGGGVAAPPTVDEAGPSRTSPPPVVPVRTSQEQQIRETAALVSSLQPNPTRVNTNPLYDAMDSGDTGDTESSESSVNGPPGSNHVNQQMAVRQQRPPPIRARRQNYQNQGMDLVPYQQSQAVVPYQPPREAVGMRRPREGPNGPERPLTYRRL